MAVANVQYLGVGRLGDRVICASYSNGLSISNTDEAISRLLQSETFSKLAPNSVYTSALDGQSWHITVDQNNFFYILMTERSYPTRVATSCITDLQKEIVAKLTVNKLNTARQHSLDGTAKGTLSALCKKYDNLKEVDQLSRVTSQVESVKLQMSENVKLALQSTESLESVNEKTEHIKAQAGLFKKQGTQLKQQEWWKACKMKLMFGGLVLVVILVIVLAIWGSTRKKD